MPTKIFVFSQPERNVENDVIWRVTGCCKDKNVVEGKDWATIFIVSVRHILFTPSKARNLRHNQGLICNTFKQHLSRVHAYESKNRNKLGNILKLKTQFLGKTELSNSTPYSVERGHLMISSW